ncbi:histidine kinase [Streptomonospora sediminis]
MLRQSRPRFTPTRDDAPTAVVAVLFVVLELAIGLNSEPTTGAAGPYAWTALRVSVAVSVLVLARLPVLVGLYAVAVSTALLLSDLLSPGLLVPMDPIVLSTVPAETPIIVFYLARRADPRQAVAIVAALTLLGTRVWDPSWDILPFGLLNTAVPALLSMYLQARRNLLQSLRERAERAEREQHLLAQQARAEERRRLAIEMHDTVTHEVSLIVLQAGALGVATKDPEARTAADAIRAAGSRAIEELRDIIGVLRDGPTEALRAAPAEGARDGGERREDRVLDPATLVAESRAAGLPVELNVHGDPADASPVIARTAYRVVQEALTNVRKHAPGAPTTVDLRYRDSGMLIEVRNAASEQSPDPVLAGSGSGTGLDGLRERVELVGGSLRAAAAPDGGYIVDVILPLQAPIVDSSRQAS